MTLPLLIGLYASMPQSGKSAVANHLVNCHCFQLRPFAGPLKRMAGSLLEELGFAPAVVTSMMRGDKTEKVFADVTLRSMLQTLGTEWGRKLIDENLWETAWKNTVGDLLHHGIAVVADDVRFPNEARAIWALGGHLWQVRRISAPAMANIHISEGQLDDFMFDRVLDNNGSLEDLYQEIDQ